MAFLEGLSQMVLRWLRIPPGTSVRSGEKTSASGVVIEDNEYISTMVDITVDDICIGENPISVSFDDGISPEVETKLTQIRDEFNTIVKWAAKDLCISGVSIYECIINDQRLVVLPHHEEVDLYLTKSKKVVAYKRDSRDTSNIKDLLIFVNYEKSSLEKVEDIKVKGESNIAFKINPMPMQLKNVKKTVQALEFTENSILRYRTQLSRIARWVNVDIGVAQGDEQKNVVDTISSAINAGSMSLTPTSDLNEFDDNLPVLPNRKGIGKPEIVSDIPNQNISELADLDYILGKINLLMRFPASYIDFSKELGTSAVSLIKSDLRYAKMCNSVRSKLEDTINDFVTESDKFRSVNPRYTMAQLPSSEDEDVLVAIDNYLDFLEKVDTYLSSAETKTEKLNRLNRFGLLITNSTSSPIIQEWLDLYSEHIKEGEGVEEPEELPGDVNFETSSGEGDLDELEDEEPIDEPDTGVEPDELTLEPSDEVEIL